MPKLSPLHWRVLVRVFELAGFKQDRVKGSHLVMTKPGVNRPVVVPMYDEVGIDIIQSNMRTARLDRDQFFELLEKAKS